MSLEGTDAQTIVNALLDQMDEYRVPWRQKMIAPMTDGCNTMAGCNAGVKKRLEQLVPQLKDLGSCNDHHIGNAAQKGVEALDEDVREAIVNIYFDLGGAKGKGLKKKKDYEKMARQNGRKLTALKKFGSTRFRSYRICIQPILYNWNSLIDYYALEFVMAATKDFNDAINYFEGRTNKIHTIREKMEEVLRNQLLKFIHPREVNDVDEDENTVKKCGKALLSIDVYEAKKCISSIKQLPASCRNTSRLG